MWNRFFFYYKWIIKYLLISKYSNKIIINNLNFEKIVLKFTNLLNNKNNLLYINLLLLILTSSKSTFFKIKRKKKLTNKKFIIKGFFLTLRKKQLFLFLDNFINIFLVSNDWFDFSKGFTIKNQLKKQQINFILKGLFNDNILVNFLVNNYFLNLVRNLKLEFFCFFKQNFFLYNFNLLRFFQFPINFKN